MHAALDLNAACMPRCGATPGRTSLRDLRGSNDLAVAVRVTGDKKRD